jgi:glutathione peroxidase-family protein
MLLNNLSAPQPEEIIVTLWSTFDETAEAFDKITPDQTRRNDLQELGFTPQVTSNIKILNYLDIMKRFLHDQSITKKYLAQRHGNVFLDLFNLRRKTTIFGWNFMALIVMKNGLVVSKLSSRASMIDEFRDGKNPLNPLQSPDRMLWTVSK